LMQIPSSFLGCFPITVPCFQNAHRILVCSCGFCLVGLQSTVYSPIQKAMTLPRITLMIWGVGATAMLGMKLALVGIPAQLGWIANALYPGIPFGISVFLALFVGWLFPVIEVVSIKSGRFFEPKRVFRFSKEYRKQDDLSQKPSRGGARG